MSSKLGYIPTEKYTTDHPTKEVDMLFANTQVMQSLSTSEQTFPSPVDSCLAPLPNLEMIVNSDNQSRTPTDDIHKDFFITHHLSRQRSLRSTLAVKGQ